jgi:hypothetical protein
MPVQPQGNPNDPGILPEFSMTGPFGGVQSELPLDQIEDLGFADVNNFIFRKGTAQLRPGYSDINIVSGPPEQSMGINDFYSINGSHQQVQWTPTRLFAWQFGGPGWTQITGVALRGTISNFFSSDVVDYKLCFSQGIDPIGIWDGIAPNFTQPVGAPAAFYLAEINGHLMTQFTLEGLSYFPNRYRWSGIGDPTDWASFSSGSNDQLNNLGPGGGILKLGQYGFGYHTNGLIQVIPTGTAAAPFVFVPMQNAAEGIFSPRTLAKINLQGQDCSVHLGVDNVYLFNQSSLETIGDAPMEGRKRQGARSRIIADVLTVNRQAVFGFVTYSINGQVFKAYWLVIPNQAVWVYNFDEGNWTRLTYNKQLVVGGPFYLSNPVIRIMDLVGRIQDQTWQPALLAGTNPYPGLLLGFSDGELGYTDFTNYSEAMGSITSGKCLFKDRRHNKTVKKFRLTVQDLGPTTYTVNLTNNKGVTQTKSLTIGTGSGDSLSALFDFSLPGLRFTYQVTVPAQSPASIIEFAPIYDVGGEQRGGMVDG